jgi:uncharacterized protein (TIGR02145 family)
MRKFIILIFVFISQISCGQFYGLNRNYEIACYGYLYNWYAIDDSREITSSSDWTVPTNAQWTDLGNHVGGFSVAGGKLKTTDEILWESPNIDATNEYGFSAIGSGSRNFNGEFISLGLQSNHWASDASVIYCKTAVNNSGTGYNTLSGTKERGFAVRLVKDATGLSDGETTTYTGNDGKTYNAIVIDELYWTTENLEETQYRNSDAIPVETDNTTWAGLTTGARCLYNNDSNNACK